MNSANWAKPSALTTLFIVRSALLFLRLLEEIDRDHWRLRYHRDDLRYLSRWPWLTAQQ